MGANASVFSGLADSATGSDLSQEKNELRGPASRLTQDASSLVICAIRVRDKVRFDLSDLACGAARYRSVDPTHACQPFSKINP